MTTPSIAELRTTWTRSSGLLQLQDEQGGHRAVGRSAPCHSRSAGSSDRGTRCTGQSPHRGRRRARLRGRGRSSRGRALALRPTRHRFRVRGHDLYTWCGFDALFLPIMLGERAEVASTCPITGTDITLTVEADGTPSAASPQSAVVGIVGHDVTSCCTTTGPQSDVCTQMPLFASRQAGEQWQAGHPGVANVDLLDAREIARTYVAAR